MPRSPISLCLLLAAGLTVAGCASLAEDVATRLAARSLTQEKNVCLISGDALRYRQCLRDRGGACTGDAATPLLHSRDAAPVAPVDPGPGPDLAAALAALPADNPAPQAAAVLSHPVVAQAVDLHNCVRGHDADVARSATVTDEGAGSTVTLQLSTAEVDDLLDKTHRSISTGAWDALADVCQSQLAAVAGSPPDSERRRRAAREHRTAVFVREYLKAYFRDGRFVQVDFTIDPAEAQADLARSLARHTPKLCDRSAGGPPDCSAVAAQLYEALRGSAGGVDRRFLKVAERKFLAREGPYSAQFPGIDFTFSPTAEHFVEVTDLQGQPLSQEYLAVGTDVIRVILEAVFDAAEGLPAQAGATGLDLGDANAALALPPFDATAGVGKVEPPDFDRIARIDDRIEATTGVLVDRVIRGIGPFSLDNEALEQAIVQIIATTVRKAVEKATWCFFSCGLDEQVAAAEKRVEDKVKSEAEKLVGKGRGAAEKSETSDQSDGCVRLRLKVRS